MRKTDFCCSCEITFSAPVSLHSFALLCCPSDSERQKICSLKVETEPRCTLYDGHDAFGNRVQRGYIPFEHSLFAYRVMGTACVDSTRPQRDACRPFYKYQSRYTQAGKGIAGLSCALKLPQSDALEAARAAMEGINGKFCYQKGVTTTLTSAEEALTLGRGVCQDYAHIMLSLLRLNSIPCRYVAGMIEGEGESHAWIEVYHNGGWYGFDPTNNRLADDGYIKITHGRDFGDCSLDRGVFYGNACQRETAHITVGRNLDNLLKQKGQQKNG